jgi:hypothetical protein
VINIWCLTIFEKWILLNYSSRRGHHPFVLPPFRPVACRWCAGIPWNSAKIKQIKAPGREDPGLLHAVVCGDTNHIY